MRAERKTGLLGLVIAILLAICRGGYAEDKEGDPATVLEDARLDEVRGELTELFARVEKAGLPLDMFADKVREGLVKKVAPSKIVTALEALEKRSMRARELLVDSGLKPRASSVELSVALLAAGIQDEPAAELMSTVRDHGLGDCCLDKALLVTLLITEMGTPGADAVSLVLELVRDKGEEGLEEWLEAKSGSKPDKDKSDKGKKPKGKKPKGKKPKGKGKSKGKPAKPHAK
jgi:hypothetical protein